MEGFLLHPFSVLGGPVCALPASGGNWGKREGRFMTPQGLNYLELCKTILAQVSPGRAAPLRKANTRDCGVQVNAKVEKIVQCSLGPKTLLCPDCDPPAPWKPPTSPGVLPDTPVANLRFFRPVSIYSPVFDRRIVPRRPGEDGTGDGGAEAAERDEELQTTFHRSGRGSNFQFLEQRYGFFHCKKCNIRWESAYVWCISGTSKVYYKQLCRKCQMKFNPYRVEPILCKGCSQTCCTCEKKQRHINMKRPHRQDLCCRCKDMRLSCDATYSFKYIV